MANGSGRRDQWAEAAAYDRFMGHWSRTCGDLFLAWLALPANQSWLDVGCGTGSLTTAILSRDAESRILGIDPSPAFVARARARLESDRTTFAIADAEAIPSADRSVDACVAGLVLNFVPDTAAALAEMRRVTRPEGTVAAFVWDYAGEMQLLRRFWDAAVDLDPAAAALHEGRRFETFTSTALQASLRTAGLTDVEGCAIDVQAHFVDFDAFWDPFLGGAGPAAAYCASLAPAARLALRERLRGSLPVQPGGAITLTCRAWAVRGFA